MTLEILLPLHRPSPRHLHSTLKSIRLQTQAASRIFVAHDAQESAKTLAALKASGLPIETLALQHWPGIGPALDQLLEASSAGWLILLEQHDELSPAAVASLTSRVNIYKDAAVFYADECEIDQEGRKTAYVARPSWSPTYLRGAAEIAAPFAVSREFCNRIGGFGTAPDSAFRFDFMLRASEASHRIPHIPQPLYLRRKLQRPGFPADLRDSLDAHLRRSGYSWQTDLLPSGRPVPGPGAAGPQPSVSVIVWHGRAEYELPLATTLASTSYPNLEVVTVGAPARGSGYSDLDGIHLKVVDESPTSWSSAGNIGAKHAHGDILLFADETLAATDPAWLQRLVMNFEDAGVGAVGPALLRPDGRVYNLGFVIDRNGEPAPILSGCEGRSEGYLGALACDREVSAVSGKALCVRRSLFERLSGFRQHYLSSYADVDFCLRLRGFQSRVISSARPRMTVHERSHRLKGLVWDRALFRDTWRQQFKDGDPFYSDALSDAMFDFSLKPDIMALIEGVRPEAQTTKARPRRGLR